MNIALYGAVGNDWLASFAKLAEGAGHRPRWRNPKLFFRDRDVEKLHDMVVVDKDHPNATTIVEAYSKQHVTVLLNNGEPGEFFAPAPRRGGRNGTGRNGQRAQQ